MKPLGPELVECAACGYHGRWTPGAAVVRHDPPTSACTVRLPVRDPHELAALSALRGPSSNIHPGRPRRETATPTPAADWRPIEYSGPNGNNERRWICRNSHGPRNRAVGHSTFHGRAALQDTIRRHMARFHPERDAEAETVNAP